MICILVIGGIFITLPIIFQYFMIKIIKSIKPNYFQQNYHYLLSKYKYQHYHQAFNSSYYHPQQYWIQQAKRIPWHKFPSKILEIQNQHFFRWFSDGQLNITQLCLDRHLINCSQQIAYYVESPLTNEVIDQKYAQSSSITYKQLHQRVCKLANSLQIDFNIKKGDRIIIYMPMIIQSIIAILACARIAAIHVVVFGGFAAKELANRIIDSQPKLIICTNVGKQPNRIINYLNIVNHALQISQFNNIVKLIFQRQNLLEKRKLQQKEYDFIQAQQSGSIISPIYVPSTHDLYILYTSGTTGTSKGIVRDHGGTALALNHALSCIHNLQPGDGMFTSSDIGWVVGHSFIVYGPLLKGLRNVLFQGKPIGTPDAGTFWNIIEKNNINHLYTSPTAIRSIRKQDPDGIYINNDKLNCLEAVIIVGQRCDVSTLQWINNHLRNKFICDTYWQTQTGSPICSNFLHFKQKFKQKPGSVCKAVPGYNVHIINEQTKQVCKPMQVGLICAKKPLPPSFMKTILNNEQKYIQKYFEEVPGSYCTGDAGYMDQDGYVYIMSRVDDIINTAGHRLSTGQMEQVLMKHPCIAQAVVIGAKDQIKGQTPVGFITIKKSRQFEPQLLIKETILLIRQQIGPVANFKLCFIVPALPKTRSGKYLRHIIRKIYNKQKYEIPTTVQDIEVIYDLQLIFNK